MGDAEMDDAQRVGAVRGQLSRLCNLISLSMVMSDGHDERQIVSLAVSSISSLTSCRPVASLLISTGSVLCAPDGSALDWPELSTRLKELDGADGSVTGTRSPWARAYALRAVGGHAGYLVVGADTAPSEDELFLLQVLAQQTGRALTTAALHQRDGETARELRTLNVKLAEANERLAASVNDLERRREIHEKLTAVAASGAGEAGISEILHQLTGLPVAVEDRFGNLLAWAGPNRPDPYPRPSARRRAEVLADARRSPRPIRDRDRVIAVAQPHNEVLGVLALVDPRRRAAEHDMFALEQGAVVLTMELAHQRSLAETELRLRRDLVDDLLTGTDDRSAVARSQALGHDLQAPHQVVVVRWPGVKSDDVLVRAIGNAVNRVRTFRALLTRRPDGVVLVATREGQDDRRRWDELHRALTTSLRSGSGAIGVGGVCDTVSEFPRSYAEAMRAVRVRLGSSSPSGVTAYEDLGIYRLLSGGQDDHDVKEFVREWLGSLIDYDGTSRSDLVRTLWQYFECGGNYDSTARALHIHRSTLRYRLRRIRELSGHDLGSVDSRLNLHIATRAWQILHGAL
ncbi:PucR family transcriptional regulator [Pseudonocardia zijingensis]